MRGTRHLDAGLLAARQRFGKRKYAGLDLDGQSSHNSVCKRGLHTSQVNEKYPDPQHNECDIHISCPSTLIVGGHLMDRHYVFSSGRGELMQS